MAKGWVLQADSLRGRARAEEFTSPVRTTSEAFEGPILKNAEEPLSQAESRGLLSHLGRFPA
jgi:hypothetical protein